jgi:hypothetical protein
MDGMNVRREWIREKCVLAVCRYNGHAVIIVLRRFRTENRFEESESKETQDEEMSNVR